jgi:hypothetical protein
MPDDTDRLIDLDAVLAEPIPVKLGGDTYYLPGDAPVEEMLRLELKAEKLSTEVKGKTAEEILEMREDLAADVDDLFRLQDSEQLPEGGLRLTDGQLQSLLTRLYEIYYPNVSADGKGGRGRPTGTQRSSRSSRRSPARSAAKRPARKRSPSSTSSRI